MGGMIQAIENGYVQQEIQKAAYKFNQELESKEKIVVGVNEYVEPEEHYSDVLKIDEKVQDEQISFLKKIKAERDNNAVENKLADLRKAAKSDENLMPYIIDAVKVYASIGEISNAMRDVFGEYHDNVKI